MIRKLIGDRDLVPAIWQGSTNIKNTPFDEQFDTWLRGYRCGMNALDTAELYSGGLSEEYVGQFIQYFPRDDLFIASKVSPANLKYDKVLLACENSLKRLKTDYIDLYQIHWTNPTVPMRESIDALLKLQESGKIKHIGVCNFTLDQLINAKKHLGSKLSTIQMEYNFWNRTCDRFILPYCQDNNILLLAYSPLHVGNFDYVDTFLLSICERYNKTPAQITLNWIVRQQNVCALVKSKNIWRTHENAESLDFELSFKDWRAIEEHFRTNVVTLKPSQITPVSTGGTDEGSSSIYKTLEEAIENKYDFTPSPMTLSQEYKFVKEMIRPVIVRERNGRYELTGGGVRYWAWVLAFGFDKDIDCIITK